MTGKGKEMSLKKEPIKVNTNGVLLTCVVLLFSSNLKKLLGILGAINKHAIKNEIDKHERKFKSITWGHSSLP